MAASVDRGVAARLDAADVPRAASSEEPRIQIPPVWIGRLDELQLPHALPSLERLLPADCGCHRGMLFVPDEVVHAVLSRKAFGHIVSMLPDAFDEVSGHTDVERASHAARDDVDTGLSRSHSKTVLGILVPKIRWLLGRLT